MTSDILVFDRAALRAHRARAAGLGVEGRFLNAEIRRRLIDRLADMKYRFQRVLDLGSGDGELPELLGPDYGAPMIVALDPALAFARRSRCAVVAEEEALPFAPACFDLILGTLGLHWTNDLPGALLQLRRSLKPDGLLLASMFGGETLRELRESLTQADLEISSGAAPRVSPFADIRDLGGLLQRAGFALPVVDAETLTLTYPHALALMAELRALGETNALRHRTRGFTRRATILRAAELYRSRFGDADGRIPATFHVITMTAWAPADTQQKPLRPGSARTRLAEALGGQEVAAGEKAAPG